MKLVIMFFVFCSFGCREKPQDDSASVSSATGAEVSLFDQIAAEVRVNRRGEGRLYSVALHNYGDVPIETYGLVRQQWSKIKDGAHSGLWEEKRNGHSHVYPKVEPGDSYETLIEPWATEGYLLRFGFVTRAQDQKDSRKLLVWSQPVNPEMDWPTKDGR